MNKQRDTVLNVVEVFEYAEACGVNTQYGYMQAYAWSCAALNALSCVCIDFSKQKKG